MDTDLGPLAERYRSRLPGSKFPALVPPSGSNCQDEIRVFYWGIEGFVKFPENVADGLPQAIRSVMNGDFWVPSEVFEFVRHAQAREQSRLLPGHSLTAREGQVLRLLMRRLTRRFPKRS